MGNKPESNEVLQPIAGEVLPSRDRCSVIVLFRSNDKITLSQTISSMRHFADQLFAMQEKAASKIQAPATPKIIVP